MPQEKPKENPSIDDLSTALAELLLAQIEEKVIKLKKKGNDKRKKGA